MTRIAVFAFIGLLAAPRIVLAHARLMSPAPRDQKDGYKDPPQGPGGPCGIARSASQPSTNMTPGAAVTVTWEETVDHNGCFVIDFAAADDQNFEVIGRKSHANPPARTGTPATRKYSMQVTLPSTPCTACTLRVRQLMLANNVAEANLTTGCPPATVASGSTYYTCANVVMSGGGAAGTGGSTGAGGSGGAVGVAGTSGTGEAGASGTSGQAGMSGTGLAGISGTGQAGTTGQGGTTGQAGNSGSGNAPGADEGGCHVAAGAGDNRSAVTPAIVIAALLALTRYRRRRSRS